MTRAPASPARLHSAPTAQRPPPRGPPPTWFRERDQRDSGCSTGSTETQKRATRADLTLLLAPPCSGRHQAPPSCRSPVFVPSVTPVASLLPVPRCHVVPLLLKVTISTRDSLSFSLPRCPPPPASPLPTSQEWEHPGKYLDRFGDLGLGLSPLVLVVRTPAMRYC